MGWNYRVIKHIRDEYKEWYGIHEVYYTDGEPTAWAKKPEVVGNNLEDLKLGLELLQKALDQPVLILDESKENASLETNNCQ